MQKYINARLYVAISGLLYIHFLKAEQSEKFNIFFNKLEHTNDEIFSVNNFKINKVGTTNFAVDLDMQQIVELNDNYTLDIIINNVDASGAEQGIPYYSLSETKICDFMKLYYPIIYEQLGDTSNVPSPETCPIPPWKSNVHAASFNLEFLTVLRQVGNYRLDLVLFKEGKKVSEFKIYGSIEKL